MYIKIRDVVSKLKQGDCNPIKVKNEIKLIGTIDQKWPTTQIIY